MQYFRLSIGGSLPGGETWSVNPCFDIGVGSAPAPSPSEMAATVQALRAVPTPANLLGILSTSASITRMRLEARSFLGGLEAVGEAAVSPPRLGTGTATKPYQTSVVTSLRTDYPGGRNRGRLYWPALAVAIGASDLRMNSAIAGNIAQACWDYLQALSAALQTSTGFTTQPAVASGTARSLQRVRYVEVGDILDVQRRRRDKALETRYRYPASA